MIASSAFVLAALTMTGVYMQSRDQESQNDGYTIDFTALENNVDDKAQEIVQNNLQDLGNATDNMPNMDDDLDYMPLEAGSSLVELPGRTDGEEHKEPSSKPSPDESASTEEFTEEPLETDTLSLEGQDAFGEGVVTGQELHYSESDGLLRPLSGDTLIPFSTDSSVYFPTLAHYKRSYAMVISSAEGTAVTACAAGTVANIYQNEEIGHAVVMDLGDGYQITYGQLRDIQVAVGSYVDAGDTIGTVSAPTKYYHREGSNLYLKLTANGTPVNPEPLFR